MPKLILACCVLVALMAYPAHALEYRGQYAVEGKDLGFVRLDSGETLGQLCAFVASKTGEPLPAPTGCVVGIFDNGGAFQRTFNPTRIGLTDEVVINVPHALVRTWFPQDPDGPGLAAIELPRIREEPRRTEAANAPRPAQRPAEASTAPTVIVRPPAQPQQPTVVVTPAPQTPTVVVQPAPAPAQLTQERDNLRDELAATKARLAETERELAVAQKAADALSAQVSAMSERDFGERWDALTWADWYFVLLVLVLVLVSALLGWLLFRARHGRVANTSAADRKEMKRLRDEHRTLQRERDDLNATLQRERQQHANAVTAAVRKAEAESAQHADADVQKRVEARVQSRTAELEEQVKYLGLRVEAHEENNEHDRTAAKEAAAAYVATRTAELETEAAARTQQEEHRHAEVLETLRTRASTERQLREATSSRAIGEIVPWVLPAELFKEPNLPEAERTVKLVRALGMVTDEDHSTHPPVITCEFHLAPRGAATNGLRTLEREFNETVVLSQALRDTLQKELKHELKTTV